MQKIITANTLIQTTVAMKSDFSARILPRGTFGTIVECYDLPEGYAVDLALPDENLVAGWAYENVILNPTQFVVIDSTLTQQHNYEYCHLVSERASNEDRVASPEETVA